MIDNKLFGKRTLFSQFTLLARLPVAACVPILRYTCTKFELAAAYRKTVANICNREALFAVNVQQRN